MLARLKFIHKAKLGSPRFIVGCSHFVHMRSQPLRSAALAGKRRPRLVLIFVFSQREHALLCTVARPWLPCATIAEPDSLTHTHRIHPALTPSPGRRAQLRNHLQSFLTGGVTALCFGYYRLHQDVYHAAEAVPQHV